MVHLDSPSKLALKQKWIANIPYTNLQFPERRRPTFAFVITIYIYVCKADNGANIRVDPVSQGVADIGPTLQTTRFHMFICMYTLYTI